MSTLSLRDMIDQSLASGKHHVKQAQQRSTYPIEKTAHVEPVRQVNHGQYTATDAILKLAEACDYITAKVAESSEHGKGPGALPISPERKEVGKLRMGGAKTERMPVKPGRESESTPGSNQRNLIETNYSDQPGDGESMNVKSSAARLMRIRHIIKAAKENFPGPANSQLPTDLEGTPTSTGIPANAGVLQNTQRVMDAKKRELKAEPKKDLEKIINEPAQSKATDPVLHDSLEHVDESGAKISSVATEAARTLLKKMASQGCTCGNRDVCGFCKLSAAVAEKEDEDEDEDESDLPSSAAAIRH